MVGVAKITPKKKAQVKKTRMRREPRSKTVKNHRTKFDSDFSPDHSTNRVAAQERGLRFSAEKGAFVDGDGCLIRDRFGQRY